MSDAFRNGHPEGIDPLILLPTEDPEVPPDPEVPVPLYRDTSQSQQVVCIKQTGMPPHTHHQSNQDIFDLKYTPSGTTKDAKVFFFAAEDAETNEYRGFAGAELGPTSDTKVQLKSGTDLSAKVDIEDGADTFSLSANVTVSPSSDGDTLKINATWSPSNSSSIRYLVAFPTRVRSNAGWDFSDYVEQGVIVAMPNGTSKTLVIPSGNSDTDYAVFVVKSTTNLIVSASTPEYYADMAPTVISNVVLVDSGH